MTVDNEVEHKEKEEKEGGGGEEVGEGGENRFMQAYSYIVRVRNQACMSVFLQGQTSWLYTNHEYNP
jgi:hypothetical protein